MNNDGKYFAQIRLAAFVIIDDLCKQQELRAREILHHVGAQAPERTATCTSKRHSCVNLKLFFGFVAVRGAHNVAVNQNSSKPLQAF